jgi:hypothetical protein
MQTKANLESVFASNKLHLIFDMLRLELYLVANDISLANIQGEP